MTANNSIDAILGRDREPSGYVAFQRERNGSRQVGLTLHQLDGQKVIFPYSYMLPVMCDFSRQNQLVSISGGGMQIIVSGRHLETEIDFLRRQEVSDIVQWDGSEPVPSGTAIVTRIDVTVGGDGGPQHGDQQDT